ncbi:hypothetical protein REC12_25480 [Desulfosporosinus sp. PR]|uniref:hypothetical protein n=1 Tax=Candidatus Desulfosporosinus nitrosoreducens TaxID=3401928 RepID=UPI0027F140CF|nr:hypothetical protein [Desulfosporosinus sp. PR]MDQ7096951.1 hypothetical protein [Desulfosporosinus sp. PR]
MEIIAAGNLLDEMKSLSADQRIFVDFPVDISNTLELFLYQIQSAEKLFNSFISNTSEVASEFNLNRFFTTYAELVRKKEGLFRNECVRLLGTQVFNFCNLPINRIRYYLDFQLKKLVITKNKVNLIPHTK